MSLSSVQEGGSDSLVARLAEEMNRRWHQGESPLVEEFLDRHPELHQQPEAAVELIYEEICLRQEFKRDIDTEALLARFPRWDGPLRALLDCHRFLEAGPMAPDFPLVGEMLGGFRLLAELGRGVQGRVFVAAQPALADRPVVLKVVPFVSQEHLSLARLQHTHIVPVYSVHDDLERNLRALCMPYFGGATLDRILTALQPSGPSERSGEQLIAVLEQLQTRAVPVAQQVPAGRFFRGLSYIRALCWLGACLADALHYAHERGLLHLDLKPSNVLLAADGQPMLLDFHLARPSLSAGASPPAWFGGTPGHMAPEQAAALNAVREGRPVPAAVDARADVYALGLLLYEALGGPLPPRPPSAGPGEPAAGLRRQNPRVSQALADLLVRCLADNPEDRYASGADLAADLRRHLAFEPLRGVVNRSWSERWRKWRRRRPLALPLLGMLLVVVLGGSLLIVLGRQRVEQAQVALQEGSEQLSREQYALAAGTLRRGLDLVADVPFSLDLRSRLLDQFRQAQQGQAVHELHRFTEHVRTLCEADELPAAQVQAAEKTCRAFWEKRHLISHRLDPKRGRLSQQVQTDLLDLAILWTGLRVRLAGANEAPSRREALEVLAQAEELFGVSRVLCQQRLFHAEALGLADLARESRRQVAQLPPQTAWEHFALGRALFQAGQPELAEAHLQRALDTQPQHLWANFYRGKCRYQQGDYTEAYCSFRICVALAPEHGWCYYNRGLAHAARGQLEQALADHNRALELDPTLAEATLNRGRLYYRLKHYDQALTDLRQALDLGARPAEVAYQQALVQLAQGDPASARASLNLALEKDPGHKEARTLLERLPRQR